MSLYQLNSIVYDILSRFNAENLEIDEKTYNDELGDFISDHCHKYIDDTDAGIILECADPNLCIQEMAASGPQIMLIDILVARLTNPKQTYTMYHFNDVVLDLLSEFAANHDDIDEKTYTGDMAYFTGVYCRDNYDDGIAQKILESTFIAIDKKYTETASNYLDVFISILTDSVCEYSYANDLA